ncbi:hypothetical protein BS47DRAFT_1393291 [Hydnum rufescens UP504]|uniref:DNA recombination and repair protein Rad51-like C-terminal domain-containing protein n=1 Tax=Hydnum rufescens UP504 TaxID=1448309 RepID=A0A9P6DX26_9AGAM|nr:hypothetical protein BS47DRAFT_1393291 [Hydnum rufescens UP504]
MLLQAFERQSVLEVRNIDGPYHHLILESHSSSPKSDTAVPDPPGSSFVDGLDEHIRDSLTFSPFPDSALNHGDVIEIQGPPGSAKTTWLYFLAMTCLLPYALTVHSSGTSFEVVLGGREKAVVVCDCDGRWSTKRMHHMLSAYLQARVGVKLTAQSLADCREDDALGITPTISSICERSLQLLHIFRPTSSLSLAATLLRLPFYHSETMCQQEISMLMIDSMSAFHWPDRWKAEQATHVATGNQPKPSVIPYSQLDLPSSLHASTQHVLDAIQMLRSRLGVITVLTNWALFPNAPVSRTPHVNSVLRPPPLRPCFKQHLLRLILLFSLQLHPHLGSAQ